MKQADEEVKRRAEEAAKKVELLKAGKPVSDGKDKNTKMIDDSLDEDIKYEEIPQKELETIEKEGEQAEGIKPDEKPSESDGIKKEET